MIGAVVVAAALALGGVVLAVMRPRALLLVVVVLDVGNLNEVIAEAVGVSPYRPMLALAAVALWSLWRQGRLVLRGSPVVVGVAVLLACFWLSPLTSWDPQTSTAVALERTQDVAFFALVYVLICSLRAWTGVMAAATVTLAVLAGVTVVHEFLLGNSGTLFGLSNVPLVDEDGVSAQRHAGPMADVNFWGRVIILFLPTALSLSTLGLIARSTARAALWALAAVTLLAGIYLTQSRGAFLALPVALLAWMLLAGRTTRRAVLVLPLAILVLGLVSGAWERIATLGQLFGEGTLSAADLSLTNRLRLMQDAARMFADRPITGQGIGTYPERFAAFDRLADTPAAPEVAGAAHNFFLEQAADGGLVLIGAWTLLFGATVVSAWRARRHLADDSGVPTRYVLSGAVAGLAGWLAASLFLHLSTFRTLLLVLAVVAAIDQDARRTGRPAAVTRRPARWRRTRAVVVATGGAAALLVAAGSAGLLVYGTAPAHRSVAVLRITVADPQDSYAAYQLDLISRGLIAPTLAEVLQRRYRAEHAFDDGVSFRPSREGGAVTVRAVGRDPVTTSRRAQEAVDWATAEVAGLQTPYVLVPSDPIDDRIGGYAPAAWAMLAAGTVLALLAAAGYLRLRRLGREPPPGAGPGAAASDEASGGVLTGVE